MQEDQSKQLPPIPFAEFITENLSVNRVSKRAAVKATTIVGWSPEDQAYIAASPLASEIGADPDPAEAKRILLDLHSEMLDAYYQKRTRFNQTKPGRPAAGCTEIHAQIKPEIKAEICKLAKDKNISVGEAIEYLFLRHLAQDSLETHHSPPK